MSASATQGGHNKRSRAYRVMLTDSRNDVASRLEVVEMAVWPQTVNMVVKL